MTKYMPMLFAAALLAACNNRPNTQQTETQSGQTETSAKTEVVKQDTASADKLIVPGKAIGQTQINEDAARVVQRLGKPDGGDAAMGKAVSIWYAHHDTSDYQTAVFSSRQVGTADDTSRVKQIRITSPWFVTKEGVHVGSALQQLNDAYPLKKVAHFTEKGNRYDLYETNQGIAFEVNAQNKCTGIVVHERDKQAAGTYLPFYSNLVKY
ncbi:hypothetical protein KHS38_17400 [Mucilaginibacter sp. Bleaf8]|uniref:hypothetical protein n=1 Tax=Mucilaginibacter sp. Bleaf8 TaxID=2834430 RepID=UPI001BCE7778|nr:hypothetical protein [Mucilaginibacter sp. Bleaf8]MBS7566188.1 hypothetical protein [Mucilaginibacter sp. Bleaf8]